MRQLLIGFLLLGMALPVAAQAAAPATTTEDVSIPVDELKVLVKPLTREELETEIEAWYERVREKAGAISAAQQSVKKTREAIDEAGEDPAAAQRSIQEATQAEEQASTGIEDPEAAAAAETAGEPADSEASDTEERLEAQATAQKDKALEGLAALQAEQTALIERFRVVLDSFARKGGEAQPYEQYVDALQAVELDPSGIEETWAAARGWLRSDEGGIRLAWRIFAFLGILVVFWVLARAVAALTHRGLERSSRMSLLARSLIERSIRNVVIGVGLLVAVASLGVEIGPLLAAVGAAGFIVGFALQGTLSNFASGLMILTYRPFDVGDVVEAGGVTGKVAEMNLVSTTFLTFDNQKIIVPNNSIWGNVITNVTAEDVRRVDLTFGVAYDAELERVERVLHETVHNHKLVLDDPEPVIKLHELADSAVVYVCRPWTRTEDYWTVYWDITHTVKDRFDAEGISIPFPQREIHLRHDGAATEGAGGARGTEPAPAEPGSSA